MILLALSSPNHSVISWLDGDGSGRVHWDIMAHLPKTNQGISEKVQRLSALPKAAVKQKGVERGWRGSRHPDLSGK